MIQAGKSITTREDKLQKITVEYFYHSIRNTGSELEQKIRQLRTIASIDKARYTSFKKQLPYVTCGIFNPPYRCTENFGWIQHFILDFDHLGNKGIDPVILKERVRSDGRIELIFISPGGDGLKIMFMLQEKCFDAVKFSLFYKLFARSFSRQHQIEQVLDPRTSDVTRACFLSTDINAFYNSSPDRISLGSFVDYDNPLEVRTITEKIRKEEQACAILEEPDEKQESQKPDDIILDQIRRTLNPHARTRFVKQIFVPEELEKTTEFITKKMNELSIGVESVRDIHYGKKFTFVLSARKAEINLFYGKRGFSVVISPKIGTDRELSEVCSSVLHELFAARTFV